MTRNYLPTICCLLTTLSTIICIGVYFGLRSRDGDYVPTTGSVLNRTDYLEYRCDRSTFCSCGCSIALPSCDTRLRRQDPGECCRPTVCTKKKNGKTKNKLLEECYVNCAYYYTFDIQLNILMLGDYQNKSFFTKTVEMM